MKRVSPKVVNGADQVVVVVGLAPGRSIHGPKRLVEYSSSVKELVLGQER